MARGRRRRKYEERRDTTIRRLQAQVGVLEAEIKKLKGKALSLPQSKGQVKVREMDSILNQDENLREALRQC